MKRQLAPLRREKAIKTLLVKMIYEHYYPQFMPNTFEAADIPTRETIELYLPKLKRLLQK